MRYSLNLTFQLKFFTQVPNLDGKKHLRIELEKLEKFCDDFGGCIKSADALGGHMIQLKNHKKTIVLYHPLLEHPLHFSVHDGKANIMRNLKIYNIACSLPDCVFEHSLIAQDHDLYFQITIKTCNEYFYNILNDLYHSMYS